MIKCLQFIHIFTFLAIVLPGSAQINTTALTAQKLESLIDQKEQELNKHRKNLDELNLSLQNLKLKENAAKDSRDQQALKEIRLHLQDLQVNLSKVESLVTTTQKKLEELLQINRASPAHQLKWIKKYEQTYGPIIPVTPGLTQTVQTINSTPHIDENANTRPNTYTLFSELTLPTSNPDSPCKVVTETNNKITKVTVGGISAFKYTPEALSSYYKDRAYMEAEALVSTQPGYQYLSLIITIHSDRARQSFGQWQQGSHLSLTLINGESVVLTNTLNDGGTVDYQKKITLYNGNFIISSKDEKTLQETPIEKLRIVWSTGFEEYEVYTMDFLIRLLTCMQKNG